MRLLSADWVLPVEGEPIADGAVAIAEDGTIAAVGPAADLGEGERHDGCVIVPGFVDAHSHIEYAVYAGFGDGLPFVPWIGIHVQRKQALDFDDMVAIATVGAHECLRSGITTIGDCSFSGAAAVAANATGLHATVYLEVFGRDGRRSSGSTSCTRSSRRCCRNVSASASRHTLPTRARSRCTRRAPRSGSPRRPTSPRARRAGWLVNGAGDGARSPSCSCRRPGDRDAAPRRRRPLHASLMAAHCVHVDAEEIALLAEQRRRCRALPALERNLGCGVAPVRELLDAGVNVSIATDSPASTPSLDLFEEIRTRSSPRGPASRPDALLGRARARARDARRRPRARPRDRIGSLAPASRQTSP